MIVRAKLPAWLRWEWDGEKASASFRCDCSPEEVQTYLAAVEEGDSSGIVHCRNCRRIIQLRASREISAEGGAPGSAKKGNGHG